MHKCGGTSLKTPAFAGCAENIYREYQKGYRPVVVVSAGGRETLLHHTFLDLAAAISSNRRPGSWICHGLRRLVSATLLVCNCRRWVVQTADADGQPGES